MRIERLTSTIVATFALAACATAPPADTVAPGCRPVPPASGGVAGAAVVAIDAPVDPARAPVPHNAAEQLVFAHLYETMVRQPCGGGVAPGLAGSWESSDGGRHWTFRLRPGLADWAGDPVTATDVLASWRGGGSGDPRRAILVLDALDERTVRVELARRVGPDFFARQELAVVGDTLAGWPAGTTAWRPREAADGLELRRGKSTLRFQVFDADARNALDAGADIVITDDGAAAAYARSIGFAVVPLPWDRTYALVVPARDAAVAEVPIGVRAALARDALRGEARAAQTSAHTCADNPPVGPVGTPPASDGRLRLVYPAGDAAAAALAERLVALARAPEQPAARWLTTLLPGAEAGVLAAPTPVIERASVGDDVAYVLPIRGGVSCIAGMTLVPLVETRSVLLVRPGVSGISLDGAGRLVLDGVLRAEGP